ncbi:hypothetical protein BZA70DRAFT_282179 [Myxozyma melibiosi]|uniref:Dystroglycan-type cadherin-like domain-containing protein n=1 Tax=Myxozyma melibiosi TaxID=54550 RepID=A0ABR1F1X1_9ASCO
MPPLSSAMAAMALNLLLLPLTAVSATPSLDFPISEQYPPVARVGEAFSFTMSSYTYTSSSSNDTTYSVSDLPSWLSFDDSSRLFSGTPSDDDIGYSSFTLIATDPADSTNSSDTATFVVADTAAPNVAISASSQLQQNYSTYSANGIGLVPGSSFSLQFAEDTFTGNVTAYYGLFSGLTPLPSWISFDSSAMTFEGTTPALSSDIAPPLNFNFVLVASDVAGYSAAQTDFTINIGEHTLTGSSVTVNATEGEKFSTTLDVLLDGSEISSSNITNVSYNGTDDWMDFDEDTLTLSGTPADDDVGESIVVTVTVVDAFGDEVQMDIDVSVLSTDNSTDVDIFSSSGISNVTATRGKSLSFTPSLKNTDYIESISASYTPSSASSWLDFDDSNYTFTGTVPSSLTSVKVILTATTTLGGKETAMFYIIGKGTVLSTTTSAHSSTSTHHHTRSITTRTLSTSTTTASSSSAPTATASSASASSSSKTSTKAIAIACGVVIPLAVLFAAAVLWYCFCFTAAAKRRRRDSNQTAVSPSGSSQISKPIPIEDDWPMNNPTPTKPSRAWDGRRLSGLSVFSGHARTYSDLEKEQHTAVNGFVIPYDPDDSSRPRRSRIFRNSRDSSRHTNGGSTMAHDRDSMASLATVATNEIFSVRLVESSNGDIAGLARSGSATSGSSGSSSENDTRRYSDAHRSVVSAGTIGAFSTSSSDRLGAVREEDIGEDSERLIRIPGIRSDTPLSEDRCTTASSSEESTQRFELVPGAREWRERSERRNLSENEPRLVAFTNGGRPASRASVSESTIYHHQHPHTDESMTSEIDDDGQVFL